MSETRWCPRCRAQTVGHDGACVCGSTRWANNPVRTYRDTPPRRRPAPQLAGQTVLLGDEDYPVIPDTTATKETP